MKWIGVKKILTYQEIKEIEKKLNIKLPEDYCNVIGKINGGALESACYADPGIGQIPYSRNTNLCSNMKGNAIDLFKIINGGSQKYFPFGSVGNGDYFCFDLNRQKVVLYLHETDQVYPLCDTYTQLMEELIE